MSFTGIPDLDQVLSVPAPQGLTILQGEAKREIALRILRQAGSRKTRTAWADFVNAPPEELRDSPTHYLACQSYEQLLQVLQRARQEGTPIEGLVIYRPDQINLPPETNRLFAGRSKAMELFIHKLFEAAVSDDLWVVVCLPDNQPPFTFGNALPAVRVSSMVLQCDLQGVTILKDRWSPDPAGTRVPLDLQSEESSAWQSQF